MRRIALAGLAAAALLAAVPAAASADQSTNVHVVGSIPALRPAATYPTTSAPRA